jgi:pyruvate-formate lyase
MERSQLLKSKLFEMDDHAIFLSRMEILKESADRYRDETAGIRFGHTLQAMLSRIDVVIDEDDLIVGRCPEVVPNAEEERWFREQFWPEIYSYHSNRDLGAKLGATPDGRKRGESISENQSPSYGMDLQGVTSCLMSMAKLPFNRTPGGGTNLKLHPSSVRGESGLACLGDLMKTYFELGGQHLQLNIIDAAILRQAQESPEEFRTLSVRVVGYSAYFTALSKRVQDDLIARTEHSI